MKVFVDTLHWFTTASHWSGGDGIPHRVYEHVAMSGAATIVAVLLALPVALVIGHTGRGGQLAINLANVGRAVPTFGVVLLSATVLGLGGWPGLGARPAFIALVLLAVPPIVTNTYVGMREVSAEAKEAARGMGMTGRQVLRGVELPLAMPLIMAGVRTSAVQVVATATLAAFAGWGGLGRYIYLGFGLQDNALILSGAILAALLAIGTEVGMGALQRVLTPRGLERTDPRGGAKTIVSAAQVPAPPAAS